MILILVGIIGILVFAVIYFNVLFYREKKNFRIKLAALQSIIVTLSQKELGQRNQIQLSEALQQKLMQANAVLNKDIFELNYELFATLFKKK